VVLIMEKAIAPRSAIPYAYRKAGEAQMLVEELLVAGVVAVGLIAVARALIRGFAMSRRRPYDAGKPTGTLPVSPEAQVPPPGG